MSVWQLTQQDIDELVAREPRMAPVVAHFGLIAHDCYDDSFSALVAIILNQQLSDQAFAQCWARLELQARTDPEYLKALIERGDYLPCTQGKRQALHAIATRFVSGAFSHHGLLALSKEERHIELGGIKGIGPWSCRGLQLCLGLDLKALPPKERRRKEAELKAHFSPVGSFATFYLWEASNARFSPL